MEKMPESIFIITSGEYSDKEPARAFKTKEEAEEFIKTHPDDVNSEIIEVFFGLPIPSEHVMCYQVNIPSTSDIDDTCILREFINNDCNFRHHHIDIIGEAQSIIKRDVNSKEYYIWGIIPARNKEHCLKIMCDIRTQVKATVSMLSGYKGEII